jgi:hypothetical protein
MLVVYLHSLYVVVETVVLLHLQRELKQIKFSIKRKRIEIIPGRDCSLDESIECFGVVDIGGIFSFPELNEKMK